MKIVFLAIITFFFGMINVTDAYPVVKDYPLIVGTYIEGYANSAADFNLWPTDAASYPNLINWLEDVSGGAPYDKWYPKIDSTKAINGTVFQGSDDDAPPQLSMSVTGLEPSASYDVYAVYWAKNPALITSSWWYTRVALAGEALIDCSYATADIIFFDDGGTGVQGCQKYIGTVSGVGFITIIIEAPPLDPADQRAWFDGVALVGLDPTWELTFTPEGQPADASVDAGQTAVFQAVFRSNPEPTVVWYHNGSGPVDTADPDTSVNTTYDGLNGEYTTTLEITNASVTDIGEYYCQIDNEPLAAVFSNTVNLVVNFSDLVAHWTLDQADFNGTAHLDEVGGYAAVPAGAPIFVAGVRQAAGAVQITPTSGWAISESIPLPINLANAFTVSVWVNWTGGAPQETDHLFVESGLSSLAAIDAINADGNWQHVCVTSENNNVQIYLNGLPVQSGTVPMGDLTDLTLDIGHTDGSQTFNGGMDDVRVYNYALNATEVWALFTARENCTLPYAREWDLSGPDHLADCIIDFYDFSIFANAWLSDYDVNDLAQFVTAWLTNGLEE